MYIYVNYFLYFGNYDCRVKSCFGLFWQIKKSTTTQTSLYEESKYINKHLFRDCVTLVHGRWFRKWVSSQDGHLLNCLKRENIVLANIRSVLIHRMVPHSVEDMTFTFPTTRHPIAIHTATLDILTAHRVGTATAAPSPKHSWQELTSSLQTK